MKKLYFIGAWIILCIATNAQLTGTKNIPGDYPDLADAITDLNAQGIGAGGVIINLLPGNTQTAPPGGYIITASGTITDFANILCNGNTIIASPSQTAGSLNDAIFKFVGSDYVSIGSFTIQENPANTITAVATNNMTEFAIGLFPATAIDGASNNTIENGIISLNRMYPNSIGIYSTNRTNAINVTTINDISSPAGANHNLHIYNNFISNTNLGIVMVGTIVASNMTTGLDIGGSGPATGNTITNYGTTITASIFPSVSLSVNGIYINNYLDFNVSHNFIESSDGGVTVNAVARGIYVQGTGMLPVAGSFFNKIQDNTVSVRSGSATSSIMGISNEMGNSAISVNISKNRIRNTTHTAGSTGPITFISNTGACQNITLNSNNFCELDVNTTGNVTFLSNNAAYPANAIVLVNDNGIVGEFNKTGAGGTVYFYFSNANADPTSSETNNNNNFSAVTVTGATTIAGWQSTAGFVTPPYGPAKTVKGNTFANITGGTGQLTLLNVSYSNTTVTANTISENTLHSVTSLGPIIALISNQGSQNFV